MINQKSYLGKTPGFANDGTMIYFMIQKDGELPDPK